MNDSTFKLIFIADLIVRSAYQIGKTPVLVVFAASLGATSTSLGFIVSLSVITGIVLKPLIGMASDHMGRRLWLYTAIALFTFIPFTYLWVQTIEQLGYIRLLHGFATALFGPVTVATIIEISPEKVAERIGWFGWARSLGYIIGPITGGWLLLILLPKHIYVVIGLFGFLAFFPIFLLPKSQKIKNQEIKKIPHLYKTLKQGYSAIWIAGFFECSLYLILYTIKIFLPLHMLSHDMSLAWTGFLLSFQEGIHLALKPVCGRIADNYGFYKPIALGLLFICGAVFLITISLQIYVLCIAFLAIGIGQALITPATIALAAKQVGIENIGTGVGLIGSLRNLGKVIGPICGGILMTLLTFIGTLYVMGGLLLVLFILVIRTNEFIRVENE